MGPPTPLRELEELYGVDISLLGTVHHSDVDPETELEFITCDKCKALGEDCHG